MTVAELIKELEKIEDKSLEVVADIGLSSRGDYQIAEVVDDVVETNEYFGTVENNGWCARTRKCVKIC